MKKTYVIGHRNPDSDSICSAIGYAYLKNALGEHAVPARAGSVNLETQYILDTFKEPAPILIDDFYPRAEDVMSEVKNWVGPEDTLWHLGKVLKDENQKAIPVLDFDHRLLGMVSVGDLAKLFFEELSALDFAKTGTRFSAVAEVLQAEVLSGESLLENTLEGRLKIAGSSLEVTSKAYVPGDIIVVGDRHDVHKLSLDLKVSAIILTSNSSIDPETLERAQKDQVVVLRSSHDTYTTARLLNQSIPVRAVMQTDIIDFAPEEHLDEVKQTISASQYRSYPVLKKGKLVGLIKRGSLILAEPQKVILVDHNERSQAIEGIEYARIIEIIDHHRLGGLQTNEPIFIRQEPVGCTATIVAGMFWHRNVEIPKNIAGLLLSAILSDTILFKSPTCTEKDRTVAKKLAEIANLDIENHGMGLLKAGSSLLKKQPKEIIHQDMKEFTIGNKKVSVSQVFVMDNSELETLKVELQEKLKEMQEKDHYDFSVLMVTNIIEEATDVLTAGDQTHIVQHAFDMEPINGVYHLPGVLSRKKQMIPPLAIAVQELSQ